MPPPTPMRMPVNSVTAVAVEPTAAMDSEPGKPADDGDIRHIKQNLKHIGGHQRQAEKQNLPGKPLRRTGGDFGFHGIHLSM